MKFDRDPLYQIFEKHLHRALMKDESAEVLVDGVIREYTELLSRKGLAPLRLLEFIEIDAREEVSDMLKKKTYGHFSFTEYKSQHAPLKKAKRGHA